MALSVDTLHTDGTRMACSSEYNGPGTTGLRIVSPTNPAPYALDHIGHAFVIVCPVKPDDDDTFGDGLDVLVNANMHNALNATLVAWETDGVEPYVADHPTDDHQRYESFVVQLRDWLMAHGSLAQGGDKVWLVSFSKGGWSVLNLILRNPTKFDFAGLFDPIVNKAQIQADAGIGSDFSGCAIGSEANYDANYDLATNIDALKAPFVGGPTRIWLAEGPAFGSPGAGSNWTNLKNALNAAAIPYFVREDRWQSVAHHWDTFVSGTESGWCPVAVDAAYQALLRTRYGPTPARQGTSVVNDYNVLIPMDEGSGDSVTEGSDASMDASVGSSTAWSTHDYSGDPVITTQEGSLGYGSYGGLGTGDRTIIAYAKWEIAIDMFTQYGALVDNEQNQGWSFFFDVWNGGRLNFYAALDTFDTDPGPPGFPCGCWRQLAVTWDAAANVARFYIDGVFNGQRTIAATEGAANGPLTVGAIRAGTLFQFWGAFGEVRLYDRKLSDAEIRQTFGVPDEEEEVGVAVAVRPFRVNGPRPLRVNQR